MKKRHEIVNRAASRRVIAASVTLLALSAGLSAGTAQADSGDARESCRQETKRVAVWPKGPKGAQQGARFKNRELTVCDGKVVARRSNEAPRQANDSGD